MGLLEQAFRSLLIRQYGSDENFDIVVNANKGDLQIFHNKVVVNDQNLVDVNSEISLSDALKIEDDFEIGDEVAIEKRIEDFGRRAIQTLKQNLISQVLAHDYEICNCASKLRRPIENRWHRHRGGYFVRRSHPEGLSPHLALLPARGLQQHVHKAVPAA